LKCWSLTPNTKLRQFKQELFWNDAAYGFEKRLGFLIQTATPEEILRT